VYPGRIFPTLLVVYRFVAFAHVLSNPEEGGSIFGYNIDEL
jgi:hypothetical protein